MAGQIRISVPFLEKRGRYVRVCAWVEWFGKKQCLWFGVDEKYGPYLVDDRSDAFVVALLTTAMRTGAELVCEAPVSRRLLYSMRHYLIPVLAANLQGFHEIEIQAEPAKKTLSCEGATATGWTGGVDSLFTVMKTIHAEEPGHRLTHLMIASNGALEEEDNGAALKVLVRKAENGIADELGLSVVGVESNIQCLTEEPFLAVAAYRQAAVILALQKLFGVYYNSSTYEYSRFSFDVQNSGYYEFVLFDYLETESTVFYSAYGAYSRAQKLRELSEYPLAHKYLHPCIHPLAEKNCGRCGKCVRTMTALYGLGTLDMFSEVFDTKAFEENRDWYIANTLAHKNSLHYAEAWMLMKERGIEPSPRVIRMARTMQAADKVVEKHRRMLADRLTGGRMGNRPKGVPSPECSAGKER